MKAYLDFEIQISALDAGRYVLSVSGPGGDARHTITLPLGDPTYEELAARLGRFDTDEAPPLTIARRPGEEREEVIERGA